MVHVILDSFEYEELSWTDLDDLDCVYNSILKDKEFGETWYDWRYDILVNDTPLANQDLWAFMRTAIHDISDRIGVNIDNFKESILCQQMFR